MFKKIVFLSLLLLCIIPWIASAVSLSPFKLPDTGNTKCYQAADPFSQIPCTGTGQDGAYNINPMSYTNNGGGTVTDNNTGLLWQQDGSHVSYSYATPYCSTLDHNLAFGNISTGWRLPTKKELMGIVDYSIAKPGPTINQTIFPNTQTDNKAYWTSTGLAFNSSYWWQVDFNNGYVYPSQDSISYVRCVNGNQLPGPSYGTPSDGTVTDNSTGLMWVQDDVAPMDWGTALAYCKGLTDIVDYSDWRLPNIKELASLTDDVKSTFIEPAIDTTSFPDAVSSFYWSSTTSAGDSSSAWGVNFGTTDLTVGSGGALVQKKVNTGYVRCVRGGKVLDSIGVFVQGGKDNGHWYLEYNRNGAWDGTATDGYVQDFGGGVANAKPVTGNWNGSGTTRIGVFSNGTWYLDLNGNGQWDGSSIDGLYNFGTGLTGALPVTGDWNGDGSTKIGVFVPNGGLWYLDYNGNGAWNGTGTDELYSFGGGVVGALPVTGDWNNDGTTKIGIFVPNDGLWYLDYNGDGVWNGTPTDKLYSFGGGIVGALPVTGDWNGSGTTKIGVFDPATGLWYVDYDGSGAWDGTPTDKLYSFGGGLAGALPVTGKW